MKKMQALTTLLLSSTLIFLSGCGVSNDNFTNEYSVKVSALHYIKDANVTIMDRHARYRERGIYDFNTTISGVRLAVGGVYVTDENNESNGSLQSTLCRHYLPELDTTVAQLKLSAPAEHAPYEYININPFTTLLIRGDFSMAALALEYPIAASIEEHFDFDTAAARKATAYAQEDQNLTKEICDALEALQSLQ